MHWKTSGRVNNEEHFTVSVLLPTYNGEKYIAEQLNSLNEQSLRPDKVYIIDDASTDRTVEIVKQFIDTNELKNWIVIENSDNQGWKKNYSNGLLICKEDLIFLSDQDDIWFPDKIETMVSVLENNRDIHVLASGLVPLYQDKHVKKHAKSTLKKYGKGFVERVAFDKHWHEIRRPGCTFAIRRDVINDFGKIWFEECSHDHALWAIGAATNSLFILNKELMMHRRHMSANTPGNEKNIKRRKCLVKNEYELIRRIDEEYHISNDNCLIFYKLRYDALNRGSFLQTLRLFKYISYYPRFMSWVADLAVIMTK